MEVLLRPMLNAYFEVGKLAPLVDWWRNNVVDLPKLKNWLLQNTPETSQKTEVEVEEVDLSSDETVDFERLQKGMRLLHAGGLHAKFYTEYLSPLLAFEEVYPDEEVEDDGSGWRRS